jgi:dihydropteroate synthase
MDQAVNDANIRVPAIIEPHRVLGGRIFDFSRQVAVMAIVNRTPDSFHDKGLTFALDAALEAAGRAIDEGAHWIDIGGVPFAPGCEVTVEQELERVLPVIQGLRDRIGTVISVDTVEPEVAYRSIAAGAHVINDASGLRNTALARVVADSKASLVITHCRAGPRVEQRRSGFVDVVSEVSAFLERKIDLAVSCGVPLERIFIDPGYDLNKNTRHSLELIRRLDEITVIGLPIMVAVSNKHFIGETVDRQQGQRLEGSLAAAVACILQGARIVRVHDVAASVVAVRMTEAILGFRHPACVRHDAE